MITIKDTRLSLRMWCNYWESEGYGKGLPRSSSISLIGLGYERQLSDSIIVPAEVELIDKLFATLPVNHQNALRAKYKMSGKDTDNALRLGLNAKPFRQSLSRSELQVMIGLDNQPAPLAG